MKKTLPVLAAVLLAASLASCSSVKQELGVGRNSPDEFMVVKRAPLTMPPEYDLRPPESGEVPPASEVANQAKAALMGGDSTPAEKGSAETSLLQKMGTEKADPEIRQTISRENGMIELGNRTLVDKLIFWEDGSGSGAEESSVVNPKQEQERLKKNQDEGKPVNEGNVPVIEKKRSTLDKIF